MGEKRALRTREQVFKEWELFTLKNGRLPSFRSKDDEERHIAMRASVITTKIKKEPEKYSELLKQREIIVRIFSKKKTKEQIYKAWKNWVLTHGELPSRRSTDYVESHLAQRICSIIRQMKEKPEKYSDIIQEYEELKDKYNPSILLYTRTFEMWKTWTLENKRTPRRHVLNTAEDKLSVEMSYCIARMKRTKVLPHIVAEYNKLRSIYGK